MKPTRSPLCCAPGLALTLALTLGALPAHATEADALAQRDSAWNTLRLQGQADQLAGLLAPDWLLTHSDGRVQTKAEYLDELRSRSRTNQAIRNEDVQVRRYGPTAVVTGVSVQAGTSAGQPWEGRFRFTRVWVQQGGDWVMVASHSSRLAPKP